MSEKQDWATQKAADALVEVTFYASAEYGKALDAVAIGFREVQAQALEEACKATCTYCAGEHSRYSPWPHKLKSNQWIHGEIGQNLPTSNVSRCAAGLIRDLTVKL